VAKNPRVSEMTPFKSSGTKRTLWSKKKLLDSQWEGKKKEERLLRPRRRMTEDLTKGKRKK